MSAKYVIMRPNGRMIFNRRFIFSNTPKTVDEWISCIQKAVDMGFNPPGDDKKVVVEQGFTRESTRTGRKRVQLNIIDTTRNRRDSIMLYDDKSPIDCR